MKHIHSFLKIIIVLFCISFFSSYGKEIHSFSSQLVSYNKYNTWTLALAEKALQERNIEALVSLGVAFDKGEGVPQDKEKALELFREGAEAKDVAGLFNYATYLSKGYCTPVDNKEAVKILDDIIETHPYFVSAYLLLGEIYDTGGGGVEKDYTKAFEIYQKVSEFPSTAFIGRLLLATHYYEGKGVEENLEKAKNIIEKDAQGGFTPAMMLLGDIYTDQKNYQKAEECYLNNYHASTGLSKANACYYLGNTYLNREDGKKSVERAIEYFKEGSNLSRNCKYKLGLFLREGNGCEKDIELSNRLLLEAADAGLGQAAYQVALDFYEGEVRPQNNEKAKYYFDKVLENERYNPDVVNSDACKIISACYRFGYGVEKNDALAADFLRRSAEYGDSNADELVKWFNNPE